MDKTSVSVRFADGTVNGGTKRVKNPNDLPNYDWSGLTIGTAEWELAAGFFLNRCDKQLYDWVALNKDRTSVFQKYYAEFNTRIMEAAASTMGTNVSSNEPKGKTVLTLVTVEKYNALKALVDAKERGVLSAKIALDAATRELGVTRASQSTVKAQNTTPTQMIPNFHVEGVPIGSAQVSFSFSQSKVAQAANNTSADIVTQIQAKVDVAREAYNKAMDDLATAKDNLSKVRKPELAVSVTSKGANGGGTSVSERSGGSSAVSAEVSVTIRDPNGVVNGLHDPYNPINWVDLDGDGIPDDPRTADCSDPNGKNRPPVDPMLVYDVVGNRTNLRCCEVRLSSASGTTKPGKKLAVTADELLATCLPSITMNASRLVTYQVVLEVIEGCPPNIVSRAPPIDEVQVVFNFDQYPQPPQANDRRHGWIIYIELVHTDSRSVWWTEYYFPFKDSWDKAGTNEQGEENRTIEAVNLFVDYPGGEAKKSLDDWVEAVGADGHWVGRVVIERGSVRPMVSDVKIGENVVVTGMLFQGASTFGIGEVYVPGYGRGVALCS